MERKTTNNIMNLVGLVGLICLTIVSFEDEVNMWLFGFLFLAWVVIWTGMRNQLLFPDKGSQTLGKTKQERKDE